MMVAGNSFEIPEESPNTPKVFIFWSRVVGNSHRLLRPLGLCRRGASRDALVAKVAAIPFGNSLYSNIESETAKSLLVCKAVSSPFGLEEPQEVFGNKHPRYMIISLFI